jgi:outer membrane protein assembly factor BamB/predicted phosphodiesterase
VIRAAPLLGLLLSACGGVIHGRVFLDLDRDRVRDPDEPGLASTAVFFEHAARTRTDAAGDYVLATPYPFGTVWAWTPDGHRPGPSYADVRGDDTTDEADVAIDIPVEPSMLSRGGATSAAAPWTFAVASDSHLLTPTPRDRWDGGDLAGAIAQLTAPAPAPPRFYTILGDLTQHSAPDEFDQLTAAIATSAVPFVPVMGNHDLHDGGHRWRRDWGPEAYAFDAGGLRVVVWNGHWADDVQRAFLHLVLDGEDPATRVVGFGHASPRDAVAREMAALGIDVLFTGHWHANRRVDRFGLVEWGTEPIWMGGLDHAPAGYRIVTVGADGALSTAARRTLRAPVLGLAAPADCAPRGRTVDVFAAAALDAGLPAVTAAWADADAGDAAPVALAATGGWTYRGALPAIGDAPRELVLTATAPSGARRVSRHAVAPCPRGGHAWATTGAWAQIQGGPTHTGAVAARVADLAPAWTVAAGGHVLAGSPIVDGDQVYVTVTDLGDGDRGGVVALSLATGRERWRLVTPRPARNAIAVEAGIAVVADSGGLVRGVDARSGRERWRRDLSKGTDSWTWHLWQPPTIAAGVVYIGSQAALGAYDLRTGVERWKKTFSRPWPWLGPTAAAAIQPDRVIFVRDRESGLWVADRAGTETAAAGGPDLWGIAGAPIVTPEAVFVANSRGEVLALDPTTMAIVRRTPLVPGGNDWSESIVGNLALADGRVFAATQANELVAVSAATGEVLWRRRAAEPGPINAVHYASDGNGVSASPVVTGDRVWLGGPDGVLRAFDAATGDERERHALGSPILAGVAPVEGGLVVATFAGTVHLLAAPRVRPPVFPWQVFPAGLSAFAIAVALRRRGGGTAA